MIIGIEASNIRAGGGITHLSELLNHANPKKQGIDKVIIWSGKSTLNQLPTKDWLEKRTHPLLDKSIFHRVLWLKTIANKEFKSCNVLFAPGGLYAGSFKPFVSMSQNMLVFEQKERARFGYNLTRLRLKILNFVQSKSFNKASGVIFISEYAKNFISKALKKSFNNTIIYHGISDRFRLAPRKQKDTSQFTPETPFKLLYVSIINVYKHQITLSKAVNELNDEGVFVKLKLVGASYPSYLKKASPYFIKNVSFVGKIPFEEVEKIYQNADAFVFPSTCENMPNILVEAMSAGLPILSSNYGPMPEILKENGIYADPCNKDELKEGIKRLYFDSHLREKLAQKSFDYSQQFNWEDCASHTFEYLVKIANTN